MAARSSDPEATRAAILGVARLQFGERGFDRTTIRSVATAAGVDPALVMHYFRNKAGLFAEASRVDVRIPDLSGVPPERLASVLVPFFVADWGPDGRLLPLLRAAASNRAAADTLVEMFTEYVAPALGALAVDRPEERAAMIGSQVVGVAVARHIIGLPALVDMDDATLADWLGPTIARYLTA
ncbi:TetR family transcriptional regulator [Cryptosporangium arvum]|uniref:Transcriptional regulator n=1 Tax=Cryptosporangium arvum DSM 44712 TaxID=927661 RepID=A0A011AGI5_9ACTN|nr:TetR family transcriptional regulator [Cryptosporangium arvum]EXG81126.1 transcriptional regulator [Cryptosporangium arvum DSM 44712]